MYTFEHKHRLRRFIRGLTADENIGLRRMFTCSTLHLRVCKSRVTGYTARRNRRQYYDLNLDEIFRFYGALLPYPHADGISIVMAHNKGIREKFREQLHYLSFHPIIGPNNWTRIYRSLNDLDMKREKSGEAKSYKFVSFFLTKNIFIRMYRSIGVLIK